MPLYSPRPVQFSEGAHFLALFWILPVAYGRDSPPRRLVCWALSRNHNPFQITVNLPSVAPSPNCTLSSRNTVPIDEDLKSPSLRTAILTTLANEAFFVVDDACYSVKSWAALLPSVAISWSGSRTSRSAVKPSSEIISSISFSKIFITSFFVFEGVKELSTFACGGLVNCSRSSTPLPQAKAGKNFVFWHPQKQNRRL